MRIAIVDDEPSEQELLIKYIMEWAGKKKELVEFFRFDNSESFLFSWEDNRQFALLILDIEMGKMNGMELAKRIRAEDEQIPILFVTGYDEYMQHGYDVSALHYLLKPVNKDKLLMVLDKFSDVHKEMTKTLVLNADGIIRVQTDKMMYIEADGHGSILHTSDRVMSLRESLGELEKATADVEGFVKCHRAYLVNMRYVSAIQNSDVILDNNNRLPISRSQMKKVQQEFLRYYKNR